MDRLGSSGRGHTVILRWIVASRARMHYFSTWDSGLGSGGRCTPRDAGSGGSIQKPHQTALGILPHLNVP
eukprot:8776047-Pyramimonas_sp.AAC.1